MNSRAFRAQGGGAGFEGFVGATAFDIGCLQHILDLLFVNRQLNDCGLELEVRPPRAHQRYSQTEGLRAGPVRLLLGSLLLTSLSGASLPFSTSLRDRGRSRSDASHWSPSRFPPALARN